MKIRMKNSHLLAAILVVPLTLTQITFPSKAEEPVSEIANLIVFVDFQDTVHKEQCYTGDPQIQKLFDGNEKNPKSLKQYIRAISYGQMEVENVIPQYDSANNKVTPYQVSMSSSEYSDGIEGDEKLINQLVQEYGDQLDLSGEELDCDGNGKIDNLMLVLPDEPANSNTSGRMNTYQGSASIGGKQIGNYTVIPEYDAYKSIIKKSGVIIHEFLHTLGCADLYWGGATGEEVPVGFWDMMATGDAGLPYPLAYTRSHDLGLFRIPEIRTSQTNYKIYAASSATSATKDQQAVILKTDRYADEFFVVEYRKPGMDYDSYMQGSGLVIYRVKEGRRGNMQGPPFGIYVFRQGDSMKDGHEKADYELLKSASYFSQESGRTSFGNASAEADLGDNALTYSDGTNSGIVIKNIGSAEGDTISFDIEFADTSDSAAWKAESDTLWSGLTDPVDRDVYTPMKMVESNGQRLAAYVDTNWHARLACWNGSTWENVFTSPQRYVSDISVTGNDDLYLAYGTGDGCYAYEYQPSAQSGRMLGNQICGTEGANPSLTCSGSKVYAACRSVDGTNNISVKSYDAQSDSWNVLTEANLQANNFVLKQYGGTLYLLKDGTTFGNNGMYLYSLAPTVDTAWKQIGDQEITGNPSSGMDLCFNGEKIYVTYYDRSQQVIESKVWTGSAWETFCPKIAVQDVSSLNTYYQDGKVYLRFVDNGTAAYRSCVVTPETGKPDPTPDPPTEPEQPTEPPQPSEPEKPTTPSKPEVPATPSAPTQPSEPEEPATPPQPVEPEQPTTPTQPTEPVIPVEPEQPTVPAESETPALPQYTADESVYGLHAAALNYKTIQLTWNKVNGATGYEVYYSTSPDSGYQFLKKLGKGAKKYKFTKAVCGTSYYFKIRPLRKVKKSITYLEESNPVTTSTVSDPVKNLKAKAQKNGKVRLTWKKARGIGTYVILRSDSSNGKYRQIGTTGKNSCMNIELEIGKTYYYKVYGVQGSYQTDECGPVGVATK